MVPTSCEGISKGLFWVLAPTVVPTSFGVHQMRVLWELAPTVGGGDTSNETAHEASSNSGGGTSNETALGASHNSGYLPLVGAHQRGLLWELALTVGTYLLWGYIK